MFTIYSRTFTKHPQILPGIKCPAHRWVTDPRLNWSKRLGTGEAGFEGRLTFNERTRPTFTPMLDPGGQWVDGMQRSRVLRVYLFTKRRTVSPNISDDKQGFANNL